MLDALVHAGYGDLTLPGYDLHAVLGQGAAGLVLRATQLSLQREVAVKVLLGCGGRDASSLERFRREARVASEVEHPHLIRLLDLDLEHDPPYLVIEFAAGGTLAARLEDQEAAGRKGLPQDTFEALARQLAEGLAALHRAGALHRDIKPANVLFDSEGAAKLGDLGLARAQDPEDDDRLTGTGAIVGTLGYIAPEGLRGEPATPASDVFSLGVTLFEALTGVHPTTWSPFAGDYTPQDPRDLRPDCPDRIATLLQRCMDADPDRRPEDGAALARALGRARPTQATALHPAIRAADLTDAPPGAATSGRGRGAALAVLVAGVGAAATWWTGGEAAPLPPRFLPAAGGGTLVVAGADPGDRVVIRTLEGAIVSVFEPSPPGEAPAPLQFPLQQLQPGARYRFQVLDGEVRPGAVARHEGTLEVPSELALLGATVDQLWVEARPPVALALGEVRSDPADGPVGLSLPAVHPGRVTLTLDPGGEAPLEVVVELPGPRDARAPRAGLGLSASRPGTTSAALLESGAGVLAILRDAAGRPSLDPAQLEELIASGDRKVLFEVDFGLAPEDPAALPELVRSGAVRALIGPDPDYIAALTKLTPELTRPVAARHATWRAHLAALVPDAPLLGPIFPLSPQVGAFQHRNRIGLPLLLRNMENIADVQLLPAAMSHPSWALQVRNFGHGLAALDRDAEIQRVWFGDHESPLGEAAQQSVYLASFETFGWSDPTWCLRGLVFCRATLGRGVTLMFEDRLVERDPLTWEGVRGLYDRLDGLSYRGPVDPPEAHTPRVTGPDGHRALLFAAHGRRVSAFVRTSAGGAVTFRPQRTGVLRASVGGAARLVRAEDEVQFRLTKVPRTFEVLRPVQPAPGSPAPEGLVVTASETEPPRG